MGELRVSTLRKKPRSGMTLFELLLVLVLLAVVSSLAMPIFDGAFSSLRLRSGCDQVLSAWTELRTLSIQSGQTYQFQFQPETGHYRLETWRGNMVDPATEQLLQEQQIAYGEWEPYESDLPEEIEFLEAESLSTDASQMAQITSLVDGATSTWSAPIIFFPDGSTSPATLLLKNENDLVQRVTLRALTGVGRKSDVMSVEEARRLKAR